MFVHENAEDFIITLLEAFDFGTDSRVAPRHIGKLGAMDITDVSDFAKITPCVLVGVLPDEDAEDEDMEAIDSRLRVRMIVLFAVTTKYSKADAGDNVHKLGRYLKQAIRGKRYTSADGNAQAVSIFKYRGSRGVAEDMGVTLVKQDYIIITQDHT